MAGPVAGPGQGAGPWHGVRPDPVPAPDPVPGAADDAEQDADQPRPRRALRGPFADPRKPVISGLDLAHRGGQLPPQHSFRVSVGYGHSVTRLPVGLQAAREVMTSPARGLS